MSFAPCWVVGIPVAVTVNIPMSTVPDPRSALTVPDVVPGITNATAFADEKLTMIAEVPFTVTD
jgi:hypothetical protein